MELVREWAMIGQFMLHKNHYLKRFSKFSSFGMKLLWDGINKISNYEFAWIIQKVIIRDYKDTTWPLFNSVVIYSKSIR